MSNPEVTISLSAPANNERDANRQNPFSLAAMGSTRWRSRSNCPHHYEASVAVDRTLPVSLCRLGLRTALRKPEGKVPGAILGAVEGEAERDQLCLLAYGDLGTEELAQACSV